MRYLETALRELCSIAEEEARLFALDDPTGIDRICALKETLANECSAALADGQLPTPRCRELLEKALRRMGANQELFAWKCAQAGARLRSLDPETRLYGKSGLPSGPAAFRARLEISA